MIFLLDSLCTRQLYLGCDWSTEEKWLPAESAGNWLSRLQSPIPIVRTSSGEASGTFQALGAAILMQGLSLSREAFCLRMFLIILLLRETAGMRLRRAYASVSRHFSRWTSEAENTQWHEYSREIFLSFLSFFPL